MKNVQEVKDVTEHLTDTQKKIALFWADGRGTVTPPGHWNQIAIDFVEKNKLDVETTAQLFAYLNMALEDAFIAAWDTKYAYWTVRPITAIGNLYGVKGFKPFILTPSFPSYISGHATFSGAASTVLIHYFPTDAKDLNAFAEEAAMSRLYGGIHYRHDNEDGLMVGRKIGTMAITQLQNKDHSK